eukprot:994087-Rhodomonas_salina.1
MLRADACENARVGCRSGVCHPGTGCHAAGRRAPDTDAVRAILFPRTPKSNTQRNPVLSTQNCGSLCWFRSA